MDSLTEKFNVFDFFNLIIGGTVFWLGIGICNFYQVKKLYTLVLCVHNDLNYMVFLSVIVFFAGAFVTGAVINEMSCWLFENVFVWEKKYIEHCLNKNQLIKNDVKLRQFRIKAEAYLNVKEMGEDDDFSINQCATYFAYCVYYLHVHGQDKKTEKLRETQGLSEILTLVFVLIPFASVLFYILGDVIYVNVKLIFVFYLMCVGCFYAFLKRSKRATENRIKMVLAVYDACVDMNKCTNTEANN